MALLTIADQSNAMEAIDTTFGQNLISSFEKEGVVHNRIVTYTNDTGAALADGSIVELILLNNCLVLPETRLVNTAMGVARTMNVGVQEYTDLGGTVVASDINALFANVDVSAAASNVAADDAASLANPGGYRISGQASILAEINGGTLPNGESITLQLKFMPYRG